MKIGERGQVTIPKKLRERYEKDGPARVKVEETSGEDVRLRGI